MGFNHDLYRILYRIYCNHELYHISYIIYIYIIYIHIYIIYIYIYMWDLHGNSICKRTS